jgi:pimeloyl-ACP methyl ester carboxylesterase
MNKARFMAEVAGEGGPMTERMVGVNGAELCTEPFGEPADPPILLVMGLGASMLWWDEDFCRALADGGRFVIRYDHRDTGRSTTYEPMRPGYSSADLVADAAGVLDAFGLPAAHVMGVSAGGAMAQLLALDFADSVLSLVLISSSPAVPVDRDLPPPSPDFSRFVGEATVDWSNRDSVIDYLTGYSRLLAGGERWFDEAACRDFLRRDVARAGSLGSLQNHYVMAHDDSPHPPLSSMAAPTLVIHGTADPMFPPAHGEALAETIPGATLLRLDGAGHGVDRADWPAIVPAILRHTAGASGRAPGAVAGGGGA